ncbi:galactokinase, partial [bacterium]|nr:galactokinase [bacterium]
MRSTFLGLSKQEGALSELYGQDHWARSQTVRYNNLLGNYQRVFSNQEICLFSTPGRVEIGGNHTDHNGGHVLVCAVNQDTIAAAAKTADNKITLHSEDYSQPFSISLVDLDPREHERGETSAILRGIAARFKTCGYAIGGFNAFVMSDVKPGLGLSSSASFEILVATIINAFYNNNAISLEELAAVSQYAENVFFGKPCGLMDQLVCAFGGILAIDFEDRSNSIIENVDFDFGAAGYSMVIADTGGNHADLASEYTAIPHEMRAVAEALHGKVLADIQTEDLLREVPHLRSKVGDRAVLRALHFMTENQRVLKQIQALEDNDFPLFLGLVNESGTSSWKWLQNCCTP